MKSALFSLLFLTLLHSCTTRYGISNAKAYVQRTVAGTVRADDNGRQMTSGVSEERYIFMEIDTARPAPQFLSAWVKQKPFSVQAVPLQQKRQVIGKTADGKEVVLLPREGHQYWQLLLTPQEAQKADDAALREKLQANDVVLQGRWKEKDFTYTIAKEEPLQPVFYQ